MRILLDTSAYTAFKRGHSELIGLVRSSGEILLSAIVLGELLSGFRWGTRYDENCRELEEFIDHPRVHLIPIAKTTADRYSRIYASLRRRGRPIPTNDMWVAAQALESGADLVTFDRHFEVVEGLALRLLS